MVSVITNFPWSLDVLNHVYFKDTAFAFNKDLLDCMARKYTKVISNIIQNISMIYYFRSVT